MADMKVSRRGFFPSYRFLLEVTFFKKKRLGRMESSISNCRVNVDRRI